MRAALLGLSILAILAGLGVEFYFAAKYRDQLSWNKENIHVPGWRMILDLRAKDRFAGNWMIGAKFAEGLGLCLFLLTLKVF